MPNTKLILGLVGEMAAGKSTVTSYLKNTYGAITFRFSDPLRDVLERLHIPANRPHLQSLSSFLRHEFGEELLSKIIAADAERSTAPFIITEGIRRPSDAAYLRQLPGFKLVAISAPERLRYERLVQRSENPDDHSKTWEDFQREGRQEAEREITTIMAEAEYTIDNTGSYEKLHRQLDDMIKNIKTGAGNT